MSTQKSDELFNIIKNFFLLGDGAALVTKLNAVYQFDILEKKGGKVLKSWTIDLKSDKGSAKEGASTFDASFSLTDSDFADLFSGKLNPQVAVVQGKMKIKGNMKKATVFTPDLFPPMTPENIQKYSKAKF
jgi:3-hydroxyacyl-CoA dehydrogenase/3a,7a,12a-trihydroxy-5b-cholest-24-enoyl-CoA hydratase